jgi:hypothetical protein
MSGKKNKMLDAGEVVLVNKPLPKPTPPEIKEIAPTTLEKMKPKRELSEKQKENVAKLIERNKQRAMERRNVITNNIPEVIPEDKIAVVVLPKRKYVRKAPAWNARPPTQSTPPSPEDTEEESDYEPVPRPKKETKKKIVVKKATKPKRYEETSATSDDEYESDSSEDEQKVEKYVRKANKRIEAVQAIESRLKKMSNPYEVRGLSIF